MKTPNAGNTGHRRSPNPPMRWLAALPAALLACSLHGQAQGQTPAPAPAAEPTAATTPAPTTVQYVTDAPSSATNFIGDRIDYQTPVKAQVTVLGSSTAKDVCIGGKANLKGVGVASLKVGTAEPKTHVLFRVKEAGEAGTDPCGEKTLTLAKAGEIVALDTDTLTKTPPNRYGLTYGTLIVPYKYQMGGDRSVAGGATLGGYLGYRATIYGSSLAFITFAGPTKVDVAQMKDGKASTESLAGLSYGIGLLGTVKDGFKAGVVVGTDRVAKSAGYANSGKAWISLSLGYDFTAQ